MKRSLLLLGILAACLALIILCLISSQKPGDVKAGRIILSQETLSAADPVNLDGEWEFYWDQLLEPESFVNNEARLTKYVTVPGFWNQVKSRELPAVGQGTYRIIVEMPHNNGIKENPQLALLIPRIYTQYRLWVNGQKLSENGMSDGKALNFMTPSVILISPSDGPIEIVLQIKNTQHIYAGIGQSILLGSATDLIQKRMVTIALDLALFAMCCLSGVYQFIIFMYHKKMKAFLWLAFVCLFIGLRGLLTNGNIAMILWPDMPFEVGSRIISIFLPCIAISLLFYLRTLYYKDIHHFLFKFFVAASVLDGILIIILPSAAFLEIGNMYLLITSSISFMMFYLSVLSLSRHEKGAVIFTLGTAFLLSCGLLEILSYFRIIRVDNLLMLGLIIFSLSQTLILTINYSKIEDESQRLNKRIRITDLNYLRAQIRPHFIFNALGTISSTISRDPDEGKRLLLDFSDFLRGYFSSESEDGLTTLSNEMNTVQSYLSLEKARFRDRLLVVYDLKADANCMVPVLSIQPLVENAVLHGLMPKIGGGKVTICTWNEDGYTHVSIEDDGVGIDAKKSFDTLELGGNSIGIQNINRRLAILYNTSLQIETTIGKGTRIEMIIPADN